MTEIERKFLIEFPDVERLKSESATKIYRIWQTYLEGCEGVQERVRKREKDGDFEYFHTKKVFLSDVSRIEDERTVSEEEYIALLKKKKKGTTTLEKTRYAVPYNGHTVEIDIYPFTREWAVCEVELAYEDEAFELLSYLKVIREITGEREYSNETLARMNNT